MLSFFSVMTKTLKFFTALIALTLASPAWAQGTIPEVTFAKVEVSGTIVDESAPFAYADGTTMLPGEEVAAVYVVTQPNVTLNADSEIPFEVAVDGTILPDETVVDRIVWPALGNVAATSRSMKIDEAGALCCRGGGCGGCCTICHPVGDVGKPRGRQRDHGSRRGLCLRGRNHLGY